MSTFIQVTDKNTGEARLINTVHVFMIYAERGDGTMLCMARHVSPELNHYYIHVTESLAEVTRKINQLDQRPAQNYTPAYPGSWTPYG